MSKKSLVQQTADKLYKLIVEEKKFTPNEQLPNELELSELLGISRTTLREAIRILALQGVVKVLRGKGTYVSSEIPSEGFNLETINKKKLHFKDLLEARLVFEPEIVKIACRRASDEEIEHIADIEKKLDKSAFFNEKHLELDQQFHEAIIKASHNEFFLEILPIINEGVKETISALFIDKEIDSDADIITKAKMHTETIYDHTSIVEFLLKRNGEGAKNAMALHIRHIINNMLDESTIEDEPIY